MPAIQADADAGNAPAAESNNDVHEPSCAAASDVITVLTAARRLVKTWRADGSISPYDEAKLYRVRDEHVTGIQGLSRLLTQLESDSKSCIVRGAFVGYEEAARREPELKSQQRKTFRRKSCLEDRPLRMLLVDIDSFQSGVADPVSAIDEFIATKLPREFFGVSYHWQLSNSAGHSSKPGLRAHVWFWLRTPYTSAQLRAWAKAVDFQGDHALFDTIQCHYTGAPIFERGVIDPVPVRSGFVNSGIDDEVDLRLDAAIAEVPTVARPTRSEKRQQAVHNDPLARFLFDHGLVKSEAEGKLNIVCPFEDEHTGDSSESSTVYFPAWTGGHERGAFDCKHDHCADRSRDEFLQKIGYVDGTDMFDIVRDDAPDAPKTRTVNDLLRQKFDPLRWIVRKVLPEGCYLLAAAPKVGKSWLALQMALAVASGTEVLGQPVEPGDVLYLDLEGNDPRLQARLHMLKAEVLLTEAQGDAFHYETQWPLANAGGVEAIDTWLIAHPNARLVVVDVLERFRPRRSAKGNLYTEDYDALKGLKALAYKHHIAVLVVHHTRKGATDDPLAMVSGTQGLAGSADGVLVLERGRMGARGSLKVMGRDIPDECDYAVDFEKCRWSMLGDARAVAKTRERQEILDALRDAGTPMSAQNIAAIVKKSRPAVAYLLARMCNEGVVLWQDHKFSPVEMFESLDPEPGA